MAKGQNANYEASSLFIPVAPLSQLQSYSRYTLQFKFHPFIAPSAGSSSTLPQKQHTLLMFKNSADGSFSAMESVCPHMGMDLSSASLSTQSIESDMPSSSPTEVEDTIIVCPWHLYDFSLSTGQSSTGMHICVYKVKIIPTEAAILGYGTGEGGDGMEMVVIESPRLDDAIGFVGGKDGEWECISFKGVSEEFAEPSYKTASSVPIGISPPPSPKSATDTVLAAVTQHLSLSPPPLPPSEESTSLFSYAYRILNTSSPPDKITLTRSAHALLQSHLSSTLSVGTPIQNVDGEKYAKLTSEMGVPPREESNEIVKPWETGKLKRGKGGSEKSRILMLHALANIEQWAVDLAWDIQVRFSTYTSSKGNKLPIGFFEDFTRMALEEAKHFSLLNELLNERGVKYGDHPTHAGLWMSALDTKDSLRARLAIIHLVCESRGLDVNPLTIEKFRKVGKEEEKAVEYLSIIHSDEVTHVATGHRWFSWICEEEGIDPIETFRADVREHFFGKIKGPFNHTDRLAAGMSPEYYEDLAGQKASWESEKVTSVLA